jgi:hypothetical protein
MIQRIDRVHELVSSARREASPEGKEALRQALVVLEELRQVVEDVQGEPWECGLVLPPEEER